MSLVHTSKSAKFVALFRAIEHTRAPDKRLFYDPYSRYFLSSYHQLGVLSCIIPGYRSLLCKYIDWRGPGARTSVVARTRQIDEMIIREVNENEINQIIILGAGFDCRAHRMNLPVHFVEVDHPNTQQVKKDLLGRQKKLPIVHVDYMPIDFEQEDLEEIMTPFLQKPHYKTLFLIEGVTSYLKGRAVATMFKYIGKFPSGTQIIFTYVEQAALDDPAAHYGLTSVLKLLERSNEGWNFGINPAAIHDFLGNENLELLYDEGSTEYRKRWMGAASEHMKGYEFFRIAHAKIK
jgi:methyltransferase (TIGR00027 family)